jgi:membrane fusion protein (multidrug efflux system)
MNIKNVTVVSMAVFLLFSACGSEDPSKKLPLDIPVYVTKGQDIPVYQEFVGQISGFKDIAIRARVEGFLEGIHFQEGSEVRGGDLLYTLESQPFEADVAAKMSLVAEARTMLAKAESDLNRTKPLAELKAVSQSDLDAAVAQHEASLASVDAAEANLRAAKIRLGYTKITSPIDGIIGKTRAKVGDFVGRSPNPVILNVVSSIETILVDFFLTETQYINLARAYGALDERRETVSTSVELELILADGSLYDHKGSVDFVDREVDPTTGAILVQASFPNPDELIRPGQFARVKVKARVIENGIMIPQRSVSELQGLYRVFVVADSNEVVLREIKVGPKVKDFWIVYEGLSPGEKVIYEGLQVVRSGMIVNPVVQDIAPIDLEDE